MKIAILTWLYNGNYGTLLQAYALQSFLKREGYDVSNINYKPSAIEKAKNLIKCHNSFSLFKEKFDGYLSKKQGQPELLCQRNKAFEQFLSKNFNLTKQYSKPNELTELSGKYDAYICGSDQIWSPMLLNPVYYFNFLSENERRYAYACSFGVSEIPSRKMEIIREYLEKFVEISVREKTGVKIVKTLTGKNVPMNVDPTLLLEYEEWNELAVNPCINGQYVFAYFLSSKKSYEEIAKKVAQKYNCELVLIPTQKEHYKFDGTIIQNAGPCEWLGLVENSCAVVTDSFHGSIFSLIFKKDFYVTKRFDDTSVKSQNSRIYTLLETYGCEDCMVSEIQDANVTNQYIELAARTFQVDHGNDDLQERAGMVGLSIATLPEDYLKRIANGYIIGVHSCVEHFLVQYRLLLGSPARGQNYSAEDDDNRLKWILNICYGNRIPHDVKQLYFICNYYRLVRNEIVHCGTGRVELRQAKTELNNLTDDLAISNIRGHLNAPNDFTNLNFDDQVLFSRAARTICDRIYKDSKYDWDVVLENYRTKINSFILSNDSEEKKKARILNFLSQIYPINVNDPRLIESISHFVV